jgi:hypothetical protein
MTCEHDHQIKQQPSWQVSQTASGFRQWNTPSGAATPTSPANTPPEPTQLKRLWLS